MSDALKRLDLVPDVILEAIKLEMKLSPDGLLLLSVHQAQSIEYFEVKPIVAVENNVAIPSLKVRKVTAQVKAGTF